MPGFFLHSAQDRLLAALNDRLALWSIGPKFVHYDIVFPIKLCGPVSPRLKTVPFLNRCTPRS